jgi:hypothetical protein
VKIDALIERDRGVGASTPFSYPYSPERVEGVLTKVHVRHPV